MNSIVLQELMLGATFLLTLLNVWNNIRNNRKNTIADDPTIARIHISLAEVLKDIAHIRQTADQTALHKEIASLRSEVAELKAAVNLLMSDRKGQQK